MSRTKVFTVSLFLAVFLLMSNGCGGGSAFQPVVTQTLVFKPDKQINDNQLLPVDIIYVTYLHQLRELTAIGPGAWFDSDKRASWLPKESVGVVGGTIKKVELNRLLTSRSPYVVIFANYKDVTNPSDQQVILDYEAYEEEFIYVHPHALEPANPDLKELY